MQMPGEQGMDAMKALMAKFRNDPPCELGGMKVVRVRDYLNDTATTVGGKPSPLNGPRGDLVILDLETDGNYVAVRPSGTEPKVKFYMFAYDPPAAADRAAFDQGCASGAESSDRADLRKFAGVYAPPSSAAGRAALRRSSRRRSRIALRPRHRASRSSRTTPASSGSVACRRRFSRNTLRKTTCAATFMRGPINFTLPSRESSIERPSTDGL